MTRVFTALLLSCLSVATVAQEKLTLTTPIAKSTTEWSIAKFSIDVENDVIEIVVKDNVGERKIVRYESAAALINGLNTANGATKSLRRRILERLQADGHLGSGTFSGGN